jgi:hypothetical protein
VAAHAHINILGDKGMYYSTSTELDSIIDRLVQNGIPPNDYNQYQACSPDNVMRAFNKEFIVPCLSHGSHPWFDRNKYSVQQRKRRIKKKKELLRGNTKSAS